MTEFVKDKDCLVCGPGILIELDTSVTLKKVIFLLFPTSSHHPFLGLCVAFYMHLASTAG